VPIENVEMSERTGITLLLITLSPPMLISLTTILHSAVDLSLSRFPRTGEPGSPPPNRCATAVREKTPDTDVRGPFTVDLSVPPLGETGARHRVKPETVVARYRGGFRQEAIGTVCCDWRPGGNGPNRRGTATAASLYRNLKRPVPRQNSAQLFTNYKGVHWARSCCCVLRNGVELLDRT
jgi:hypothetical protein